MGASVIRNDLWDEEKRTTVSLLFARNTLRGLSLLSLGRGGTHGVRLLVLGGVGTGVLGRHVVDSFVWVL
jgi:hypothetical protein